MSFRSLALVPGLIANRISRGRWLDVLIVHSPPQGIHDGKTTRIPVSGYSLT